MIRLSVTHLDAWVNFVAPAEEWYEVTQAEFVAQLRRQLPETPEMKAGKAFHRVLEAATAGDEIGCAEVDGFTFHFAGDMEVVLPPARELSIERTYQTPAGLVLLRGRIDGEDGFTVIDHKLTFGALDVERYAESLQWRAYLDMTGRTRFEYHVFTGKLQDRAVTVNEHHGFTFWSYPEMAGEIRQRVCELAGFVRTHVPDLVTPDPVLS